MQENLKILVLDPLLKSKLIESLGNINSQNLSLRKKSEKILEESRDVVGYSGSLLAISRDLGLKYSGKFDVDVCHAASIMFGRAIVQDWLVNDPEVTKTELLK